MTIEIHAVSDLDALAPYAGAWESLHRGDSQATVFSSWPWMRGRFEGLATPWWVLVARAAGEVVGLLPLRRLGARDDDTLTHAGSKLADYTGFLLAPGFEEPALAAFAAHLHRWTDWRTLVLRDVLDARLDAFLDRLRAPEVEDVEDVEVEHRPPHSCPRVDLAETWDGYLATRLSSSMRATVRRKMRRVEALAGLRRTGTGDDPQGGIEILLELWQKRWNRLPPERLGEFRSVLRGALEADLLVLRLLWDNGGPFAALGGFRDPKHDAFRYYLSGFDQRRRDLSPGLVVVAESIRQAIRDGFATYDFLRGEEDYKLSFGAENREIRNVTVTRKR